MNQRMDFRETTALVTGASRGLGAALARKLAERGSRVVLVARGQEALAGAVATIRARGGEAHGLAFDVADKEGVYALAGSAAELVGPIDLLIHNASELGPTPLRALLDTECEALERVLAVNLVGPFRLTKALAGSMALRGRGTILHVSSDAAVNAYPGWGAYSAAKAGLDQLGRVLAVELAAHGVRVLSVDPGDMDTELHARAVPDADRSALANPDEVAETLLAILQEPSLESGSRVEAQRFAARRRAP